MAKKAKTEEIKEVTIRYDLIDLPTAQHKAGLAGLVLAIRSLKNRSDNDPVAIPPETVPEFVEGPTTNFVAIRFTHVSFSQLINDVYDADPTRTVQEESHARTRRQRRPIRWLVACRIDVYDKRTDKTTTKEGYVYLDAVPRLKSNWFRSARTRPLVKKSWCDFLKSVVRDSKKWCAISP